MRLAAIGECMLEMRADASGSFRLSYGGDVFNTAVYARYLGMDVSFVSALGDDYYSDWLRERWQSHDLDCSCLRVLPGAAPALYIIRNDAAGERTFHYWRDASPFRRLLDDSGYCATLEAFLADHEAVYWSGITLALLPEDRRRWLLDLLAALRARGLRVAFDSNYRPRLWQSVDEARRWLEAAWAVADIALPSGDDERLLHGDDDVTSRLQALGAPEVVLKLGSAGCVVDHVSYALQTPVKVVDATAAGDSFNAAYLAARWRGSAQPEAVAAAQRLSAIVVQHPGALVDRALVVP